MDGKEAIEKLKLEVMNWIIHCPKEIKILQSCQVFIDMLECNVHKMKYLPNIGFISADSIRHDNIAEGKSEEYMAKFGPSIEAEITVSWVGELGAAEMIVSMSIHDDKTYSMYGTKGDTTVKFNSHPVNSMHQGLLQLIS